MGIITDFEQYKETARYFVKKKYGRGFSCETESINDLQYSDEYFVFSRVSNDEDEESVVVKVENNKVIDYQHETITEPDEEAVRIPMVKLTDLIKKT